MRASGAAGSGGVRFVGQKSFRPIHWKCKPAIQLQWQWQWLWLCRAPPPPPPPPLSKQR